MRDDDDRPLAYGTAVALAHLKHVPRLRGRPLDALGALAYGLDVDARCWVQWQAATDDDARAQVEHIRGVMQVSTRTSAWRLGLLALDDVPRVPRDAAGRDVELTELLAVPWDEITAEARRYLADLNP